MIYLQDRCQKKIYAGFYHPSRCSRRAIKDGWCKQHHPETIAARHKARNEKFERKWNARIQRQKAKDAENEYNRLASCYCHARGFSKELLQTLVQGEKSGS